MKFSIDDRLEICVGSCLKMAVVSKEQFLNQFEFPRETSQRSVEELQSLLFEFQEIFSANDFDIEKTHNVTHSIDTINLKPIHTKQYRLPHSQIKKAEDCIQEMLNADIIEPARSSWNSPFILVDKPDGSTRFVIDFRKLNEQTLKDKLPMPNIEELLDKLSGSFVFSSLDLTSGFWQIPLAETSKQKTAFAINNNQYQFKKMPFGLCNAPSTFQRLMMNITSGLPITPYIDDVIVPSTSNSDNLKLLKQIFIRLREANFKLKPRKCKLLTSEIKYLGFIVSSGKLSPNPEKIKAISSIKMPETLKQLQHFLGMCNFFSRFIPNYVLKAQSLTSFQNKNKNEFKKQWDTFREELQKAFENIKTEISNITSTNLPNFKLPFTLNVDASDHSIGGVLHQNNMPVCFYSRKLSVSERNYSTIDKEFLALYTCIKRFRPYLFGVKFYAFTDHKPLVNFLKHSMHSTRQQRWFLQLQEYDFDLNHIKGKDNIVSDLLSRQSCPVVPSIDNSLYSQFQLAQQGSKIVQNRIDFLNKKDSCDLKMIYVRQLKNVISYFCQLSM